MSELDFFMENQYLLKIKYFVKYISFTYNHVIDNTVICKRIAFFHHCFKTWQFVDSKVRK